MEISVEKFYEFADKYPAFAAVLIATVVWPTITGALSLVYHKLEERYPLAVEYMRGAGLDLPKVFAAIRSAWPKRLPPPPPLPLLGVVCFCLLVSCGGVKDSIASGLEAARDIANAAEPCLVAQHEAAVEQCAGDAKCLETVSAVFEPIAKAFDMFHDAWCAVSPSSEGCK